ncbi:MAG: hypothetical protein PVSMB4_09650 [Ktedonobacterales bacterium]
MTDTTEQRRFDLSRDEHLKKSQAFLQEASNLLRNDLLYRSVLADAVSAIKHSLQAYLWSRVGSAPSSEQRQRWQEIALDGSMPKLLEAAASAGLKLGDYDRKIKDLTSMRNARTHDSPQSPTAPEQAASAVQIADEIRKRVNAAIAGRPAPVAAAAESVSRPPTIVPRPAAQDAPKSTVATPWVEAARAAPSASSASPSAASGSATSASVSTTPRDPSTSSSSVRQHSGGGFWRLLAVAVALILGVAAGAAVTYPVASGHAPSWLPFAAALAPATPTVTVQPTATALPTGPYLAGDLSVTPSGCGATATTVVLRNTGASTLNWAAGSADAPTIRLALTPSGDAHPTLTGHLAPGASTTVYGTGLAANPAHVVVIADGGVVAALLPAC